MIDYPHRLSLAQLPTPLQPLRRLQQRLGGPLIWVKRDDMTGATLTGNKVRKLEFLLADAQVQGCTAIITCGGIQSNHCRASALAAAQLGLDCHLILRGVPMPGQLAEGNQLLDQLAGASIDYVAPTDYIANLDALINAQIECYKGQRKKALAIPTGGSNGVGIWGYIAAAEEIVSDCRLHQIRPGVIVCATGSGGTQAGLSVGAALFASELPVYGINVCDDAAWFIEKIARDIAEWRALYPGSTAALAENLPDIQVIDGYVGAGYGQASESVFATIKLLAALEGVVLDPVYTGKAFDGLLKEIKLGRFAELSDIVFVHTGGVFGLLPFSRELYGS